MITRPLFIFLSIIAAAVATASPAQAALHIEEAAKYSKSRGGLILLVWRNGTVQSRHIQDVDEHTAVDIFSITKSLTALAWLSRYPGDQIVEAGRNRRRIPAYLLLSQTSGLAPDASALYSRSLRDVRQRAAQTRFIAEPGSVFAYGPSNYETLGAAFNAGPDRLRNPAKSLFLSRIGITAPTWRLDREGNAYCSAGAFLTAMDLLKIGRVILSGGSIAPWARVIPEARLQAALKGSAANPAYGWGFWLNRGAGHEEARERDIEDSLGANLSQSEWKRMCLSKHAPTDLVCMAGSGGQRVYLSRSMNLIVVRIGKKGGFHDPEFLRTLFTGAGR